MMTTFDLIPGTATDAIMASAYCFDDAQALGRIVTII